MKKVFTEFHNTGHDAVSAFLGDEPSHPGVQRMKVTSSSSSLHSLLQLSTVQEGVVVADVVDDNNANKCVLKALTRVEQWLPGRRYLMAPAVLGACPNVWTCTNDNSSVQHLGTCLLANQNKNSNSISSSNNNNNDDNEQQHQQWSTAVLVVHHNYLLEYSNSDSDNTVIRGYAHLAYSTSHAHPTDPHVLTLAFYGSPCARADARSVCIRVKDSNQRDEWIKCLQCASAMTVSDVYTQEQQLGCGSYASVYAATKNRSGHEQKCAIKVFDKQLFWKMVVKGRERADTVVREASVQATLTARCGQVKSFLRIQGFLETADHVVIESELLEGTDLFKYVSSKGVLSETEAAAIMKDILVCLEAMNRIGLAHRDIKPANILMCKDGASPKIKVADFGMATFIGEDGRVRGRCGTPGYVAPEIFAAGVNGGYSSKVDVFSAGVVLYVMLCGYEPFYGETDAELVQANREASVDFPADEWKHISSGARDLVQKMMEANPEKRLTSKEALRHSWFQLIHIDDVDLLDEGLASQALHDINNCIIS
jgi:serine/threonine protein kinase